MFVFANLLLLANKLCVYLYQMACNVVILDFSQHTDIFAVRNIDLNKNANLLPIIY